MKVLLFSLFSLSLPFGGSDGLVQHVDVVQPASAFCVVETTYGGITYTSQPYDNCDDAKYDVYLWLCDQGWEGCSR